MVYGLVDGGAFDVNGQTTGILIVLMFGAGTDYCLLLVSRYREELREYEDEHEAMAHATERTAPAIVSAGGTVFAAMLVLTLADLKSTQSMGPVLALGVAVTLLAGLTLLPAVLSVLGRRAFWPSVPRVGSEQKKPVDVWRKVGHFVHDNAPVATIVCVPVLAVGALGNLHRPRQPRLRRGLPQRPGLDPRPGGDRRGAFGRAGRRHQRGRRQRPANVEAVTAAAQESDAVVTAQPVSVSEDGELARST